MLSSQLQTTLLKTAHIMAPGSPRQAFYHLWLEETPDGFRVGKASGASDHIWHRQVWECATLAQAEALCHWRLREKANPSRSSPQR